MTASAGWYPDPLNDGQWAWWDGVQWRRPVQETDDRLETRPWLPRLRTLRFPAVGVAILSTLLIVASNVLGGDDPNQADVTTFLLGIGALLFMAIGIPLLAWICSRAFGSKRFTRDLGWRIHWWDLPLGIAGAIAMWGLAIGVGALTKVIGLPEGNNTDTIKDQLEQNPQSAFVLLVLVLATAAVLAPLTEELLFRGMLFRGLLSRLPAGAAVGIQGVVFGCAHVVPSLGTANFGMLIVLSSLGLCLGTMAWLTGRLWSGIIAHALFNASNVILLYLTVKR